jgi:hypothetical protein
MSWFGSIKYSFSYQLVQAHGGMGHNLRVYF